MKPVVLTAIMAAAIACAPAAMAQTRPFDPRTYQDRVVGEPTQILVLATPHLSGAPEGWSEANLALLLDRLAAFRPDAIMIETLSGESIDALQRYRSIYPESASNYAGFTIAVTAMASVGVDLDMPQAEAEVRRVLSEWPAEPTAAQRRRLAALFAASGDPHSALVQWWRLAPADRIAEDGITTRLLNAFNEYDTRKNENHQIASRLAVRLGLERVYATDDHAADDVGAQFWEDFQVMYDGGWGAEVMANQAFVPLREAAQNLSTPEQALATYRMLNTNATGRTDSDGQWLSMMTRETPNHVGRARVAFWEARNLRQIAHIREVSARYPGQRLLVIVGSAHKPWFDAYLRMMSDVQVVDATRVLR
ncbi:MAG TPA: DUF5694 domain-containing protein [Terricaulis sp.]|nr:DUF5694 domain-containing protein [Terricaulis sp.]